MNNNDNKQKYTFLEVSGIIGSLFNRKFLEFQNNLSNELQIVLDNELLKVFGEATNKMPLEEIPFSKIINLQFVKALEESKKFFENNIQEVKETKGEILTKEQKYDFTRLMLYDEVERDYKTWKKAIEHDCESEDEIILSFMECQQYKKHYEDWIKGKKKLSKGMLYHPEPYHKTKENDNKVA